MFDLLLQGGTVIDGTGQPRRTADVAIQRGRIVEVGPLRNARAACVVECLGKVVSPGFIDVHNHSEGWLLSLGHLTPKTTQGFTTEVLMSDGISYAPVASWNYRDWITYLRPLNGLTIADYSGWTSLDEFLSRLAGRVAQNVIALAPYANIRVQSLGWQAGPPDDTQIKRMKREVRLAMQDGAVGVSTGLDYVSQCHARTDELAEVLSAMSPERGLYVTHIRYKWGVLRGLQEAVAIAKTAGVRLHVSHLKPVSAASCEELLTYIDRVASREVDFSFDVYPYFPGSTAIHSLLPYSAWADGPLGVVAHLREPATQTAFAELLADYQLPLDQIRLAWVATQENAQFLGQTLAQFAAARGQPAAVAMADLLIEEQLAALAVFHAGDDRLVEPMLQHPAMLVGSDGIYHPGGWVHPRVYGTAGRMLGPLVRDRKLFSLEQSVHKLSGGPAQRFGLHDRGTIAPGQAADLVVFDANTVTDLATYDKPHQPCLGIEQVFVNGVAVVVDGCPVELPRDTMPGQRLSYHPGG